MYLTVVKCLETTCVVNWRYINKTELNSGLGLSSSVHPTSDVFTWGAQSGRGLSLSPGPWSGRVVPSLRCGAHDLGSLWSGGGGSVCHGGVNSLPPVVFPNRGIRRTGPRRASSSLASGSPVRFSAPLSDLAYTTEGSQRGPQVVAGGSVMASAAVVPAASEPVSRHPMVSSNQEGSTVPVGRTDMAQRPSTSPAVGMAAEWVFGPCQAHYIEC
ncbi:hypothetical protein ATANTOWER_010530 [Ataeniobius toweri]|uniref:Uncharacterized protein n=1 Tax=Ataeniobius toweri TaxID=208326 RepID=A0ABU7AEC9_9TELE|nr:hypothetical protein [Ataeniobius toweri]